MGFDYVVQGPPTIQAGLNLALLLDQVDNVLYVWNAELTSWIQVGNSTAANDSVQNLTTSQPISFFGATNTFIKATAGNSGITLSLLNATGLSGRRIRIIMVDTGSGGVTISAQFGQMINGNTNYELSNQYQSVTLESDNANWFVVCTAN